MGHFWNFKKFHNRYALTSKYKSNIFFHLIFLCFICIQTLIYQTKLTLFFTYNFYGFPTFLEFTISSMNKLETNINFTNCKLCNFTIRNQEFSNSQENDLLIAASITKVAQLSIYARTLRTVHSKCLCVILLDEEAYHSIDKITMESLIDCGVQVVNFGKFIYPKGTGFIYRFHVINEFIRINQDKINRVIMCDIFDTVFQGDPFNSQVSKYTLNLVDEGKPYCHTWTHANRAWLRIYNSSYPLERDMRFNYFCVAYIAGPIDLIIPLMNEYLTFFSIHLKGNDQGVINYLYLSGILQKLAIPVNKFRNNELVHHTFFSKFTTDYKFGFVPSIRNNSLYASIVHHSYAVHSLKYTLIDCCPRINKSMKDYIRGLNEKQIRNHEKSHNL